MRATRGILIFLAGMVLPTALLVLVLWNPECRNPGYTAVAVLPLDSSAGDSAGTLAEGISRRLAAELTELGVRVVPWSTTMQTAGNGSSIREAAARLGADAMVQGSLGVEEDKVRGEVLLYDGRTGETIHSFAFEKPRVDLFYLERHLAARYASPIHSLLLGEEPVLPDPGREVRRAEALCTEAQDPFREDTPDGNETARKLYDRALVLDPECVEAYLGMATLYYRRGAMQQAIPMYRVAARLAPDHPGPWRGLIRCYWSEGRYDRCLEVGAQVPGHFRLLDRLILHGEAFVYGGLPGKAVPFLERARELDPQNDGVLWVLVMAYVWSGQYDEGILAAGEYLTHVDDSDYWIHTFLAEAFFGLGHLDSAAAHHERALAIPSTMDAVNCLPLGAIHGSLGRAEEAQRIWADCVQRIRESISRRGQLGYGPSLMAILARMGDESGFQDEADRMQAHYLGQGADGFQYWMLGLAYAVLERYEEAFALLRKAVSLGTNAYHGSIRADGRGQQFWAVDALRRAPGWPELERELQADLEQKWERYGVPLPESR